MKKVLKAVAVLIAVVALCGVVAVQTATVVRQLRPAAELKANGVAERTRSADALDYSIALEIAAPPEVVWALLIDAKGFPAWNSTVTKIDGDIKKGSHIVLAVKSAGDRTFPLTVGEFDAPKLMTWEEPSKVFGGVRTFTLTKTATGTTFAMSETLSGRMLPMIEGSLPDFSPDFNGFAADLKKAAEKAAPAPAPVEPPAP